jgi:hypothetical protein
MGHRRLRCRRPLCRRSSPSASPSMMAGEYENYCFAIRNVVATACHDYYGFLIASGRKARFN